jgi:TetR/AcrR family transcriptional regulator
MSKTADVSAISKGDGRRARRKPAWGEDIQSTEEQRAAREAILFDTAARLFNRYGFHGTSMSLLTEELGLTKGALYYYVKDKRDLLYRLHLKSIEAIRNSYERGVREGNNGYERVHGTIRHYVSAVTSSHTETFVLLEEGALTPEQTAEIVAKRKQLDHELRDQIAAGIADGSIAPCDAKLVALTLVGAMAWVSKWYDPEEAWSSAQVSQAMADLLGRMIAAAPPSKLESV